jgi:hypothetical protein
VFTEEIIGESSVRIIRIYRFFRQRHRPPSDALDDGHDIVYRLG